MEPVLRLKWKIRAVNPKPKILNSNQRYLKFPLTLPLSPVGRGRGVRGQNVRSKFSDLNCKNLNKLKYPNYNFKTA
jgi:hypothetical protein